MTKDDILEGLVEFLLYNLISMAIMIIGSWIVYGIGKAIHKELRAVFSKTTPRQKAWKWICISMSSVLSVLFLGLAVDEWWHYGDTEIEHSDKQHWKVDEDYVKQIEVEAFINTADNIAKIFAGEKIPQELMEHTPDAQWGYRLQNWGMEEYNTFVIVRLKNIGPKAVSGFLYVEHTLQGSVDVPFLPPHMKEFVNIVVPSTFFRYAQGGSKKYIPPTPYPKCDIKWQILTTE